MTERNEHTSKDISSHAAVLIHMTADNLIDLATRDRDQIEDMATLIRSVAASALTQTRDSAA